MKRGWLALRLGLLVGGMSAGLVILVATLGWLALARQLDLRQEQGLEQKMTQVGDLLSKRGAPSFHGGVERLAGIVQGHSNLALNILGGTAQTPLAWAFGNVAGPEDVGSIPIDGALVVRPWEDTASNKWRVASRVMVAADGGQFRVYLSANGDDNHALVGSYLRSIATSLPALLVLICVGAWWAVKRGLSPLGRFRRIASRVSALDLSHRLPVSEQPRELAELAQEINVMLDRIDEGVTRLTQFSDDLAHELRSPLSNLMGKAQVTLSRERTSGEYKAVLESSTEELGRISRIIADMLFLAQLDHFDGPMPSELVTLEVEVHTVTDLFSASLEEKNLSLGVCGGATVRGNRLMIQRAISNLLSNAIRHSPAESHIHVALATSSHGAELSISNEGEGLVAEHLEKVFERFYRTDASRSRPEGGTGLGLTIVRTIMQLHDGSVHASSIPAGPTRFSLRFGSERSRNS